MIRLLLLLLMTSSYGLNLINHSKQTLVYDPQINHQSLFLQKGKLRPHQTNNDLFSHLNYSIHPTLDLYLWFSTKTVDLPLANTVIIHNISSHQHCEITVTGSQTNAIDMQQPTIRTEHCFD